MNNYTVEADPRVKEDLKEAGNFLESRRKGLRKRFLKEYKDCLHTLKKVTFDNPRYEDVYCLPLKTFRYMIHFQTDYNKNKVSIRALISTDLNPKDNWL